jgi:hypothetical protein
VAAERHGHAHPTDVRQRAHAERQLAVADALRRGRQDERRGGSDLRRCVVPSGPRARRRGEHRNRERDHQPPASRTHRFAPFGGSEAGMDAMWRLRPAARRLAPCTAETLVGTPLYHARLASPSLTDRFSVARRRRLASFGA